MAFHRCSIYQEDGNPVATDVTATIEQTEREGVAEWYGTITVTHRIALASGQRYRLVLGDGRKGEFIVRRSTFAGGVDRAVAIRGTGPLT